MSEQQYQSQKQQQQKTRQTEQQRDSQTQGQPPATGYAPSSTSTTAPQASKRNPTLSMGVLKQTAGRAGEFTITLEKFWVQVGNSFPCGFKVATRPENELEVTLEQLSYRRVHNGRGGLTTQVIPVVPIGTKGRVIARDITTGEIVEQPWKWHRIGPFSNLWNLIKDLLFKSG
jgi:hypothetical protein